MTDGVRMIRFYEIKQLRKLFLYVYILYSRFAFSVSEKPEMTDKIFINYSNSATRFINFNNSSDPEMKQRPIMIFTLRVRDMY